MSIDKWLNEKDSKEQTIKREEAFKQLSKEEVQELKKKKIRDMVKKETEKQSIISEREKFLKEILEFKDWLNQRTYLKGDFDKIEMWIRNLNSLLTILSENRENSVIHDEKKNIINKYKEIPPKFLDEKVRIAINKLIHGSKRTNSDNYYIRKLKNTLKEKLKEAEYYDTLDKLIRIL
ncbi:MAG: hypothetical protein ACFE9S_11765 [Candidatus Hermodarchaeota archaeon]